MASSSEKEGDIAAILSDPSREMVSESEPESEFAVYFKGLVAEEKAGIGVAIHDPRGKLIFEAKKPLLGNGTSCVAAEASALVEALGDALALDLKRIVLYGHNITIHKFVSLTLFLCL